MLCIRDHPEHLAHCILLWSLARDGESSSEIMQLDFEMENFTSQSVTRRIMWHIDYRGRNPPPDLEKVVTELTVIQRDIRAIVPLAMVRGFALAPAFWFDSGDGLLSLEDFAGRDGCGCGLPCSWLSH